MFSSRTTNSLIAAAVVALATANALTAIASPSTTQISTDAYARAIERTMELRQEENVPDKVNTPRHIVDQVVAAELKRPVTRDSGDQYGVNPGKNELTVCVTNPYDCARAKSAIQDAERISSERFPGPSGDNIQDADRHCIWQALTTIRANVDFARKIGDAHEDDHPGTPESREMDQANNQTGRDIGLRHEEDEEGAIDECHAKAEDGQLMVIA